MPDGFRGAASSSGPGFAWVLNLDAELEMSEPSYSPSARVLAQLERYGRDSRALLGPRDALLDGSNDGRGVATSDDEPGRKLSSERARGLTGRAWCPTPRALARMAQASVEPEPYPQLAVLHAVNHRRFAVALALGLPEQRYIEERATLETLLEDNAKNERAWLLKRPLSFAGRGQQRVFGKVDAKQWAWVDASLRRSGLVVEPLVKPTLEVSLHGFIWRDARRELGRICVQTVSERGVFRGIRAMRAGELSPGEETSLFGAAEQTASALTAAGYFGPFGIDGYRYELDGHTAFCPLGEINARYSMGFVTGFPRHPSELSLA